MRRSASHGVAFLGAVVTALVLLGANLQSGSNFVGDLSGTSADTSTVTRGSAAVVTSSIAGDVSEGIACPPLPSPNLSFTPEEFAAGNRDRYMNLPMMNQNGRTEASIHERVVKAMDRESSPPHGLAHKGNPPGHDVVMGLAAWPTAMGTLLILVGSLRNTGYDGHIMLGVHNEIPKAEEEFLQKMDVTFYKVEFVPCSTPIDTNAERNVVRSQGSRGLEHLKLEWGRFEMARQWLHACTECTGWVLVMDTRDAFFQSKPFDSLSSPESACHELLLIEEMSKHTCPLADPLRYNSLDHWFYKSVNEQCYGADHHKVWGDYRPMLCSGTVIGTRNGMHRFLSVLVDEFLINNKKAECRTSVVDQSTMNYLYYTGQFGERARTKTIPYGTGPVYTIGSSCVNEHLPDGPSRYRALDIVKFDNVTGLILNINEPEGGNANVAPVVHQYDRCEWIHDFFGKNPTVIPRRIDDVKPVSWKSAGAPA